MTATLNFATAPGHQVLNVLINPNLRHRVLKMRRNFQQQRQDIDYIVYCAEVV